jgi:hypothetical protein
VCLVGGSPPPSTEAAAALEFAREGDVLVVALLDRLARSMRQLLTTVDVLTTRGIGLRSLHENIDTTSATGRLILHICAVLGQFEVSFFVSDQTRTGSQPRPWLYRWPSTGIERHPDKGGEGNAGIRQHELPSRSSDRSGSSSTLYRHVPDGRATVAETALCGAASVRVPDPSGLLSS